MDPKALLDELMGRDRDLPLHQQKGKLTFDDPEVCHFHLAAFCPNDLFHNTKSDLGACPKIHDDNLRPEYEQSSKVAQFEAELLAYLDRLIGDLERKIRRCQERLGKEVPQSDESKATSEKVSGITEQVQVLLRQAEKEGEEGMVDEAQETMLKVDALNKEKDELLRSLTPEFLASSVIEKEKRMQVCDVCGAMQAQTDTEKRLASHLEGKQHLGYARIRETAERLRKKKEEERERRRNNAELAPSSSVNGRDEPGGTTSAVDAETSRGNGAEPANRDRERSRSRERDSQGARRQRERDRDRERDRERERDKDRARTGERVRDREGERAGDKVRDWDRDGGGEKGRDRGRERETGRGERERNSGRGLERERGRESERGRERVGGKERERERDDKGAERDRARGVESGERSFRREPNGRERSFRDQNRKRDTHSKGP